jgi:ATP-dependent Lon protease
VEATSMPRQGFQVTGSIGNVMNESARAALSFCPFTHNNWAWIGNFNKSDIHLHILWRPTGCPAGVTIATSLVSLVSTQGQTACWHDR